MRISDWSSDVCSSDLSCVAGAPAVTDLLRALERAVFSAQRLARGLDLVLAQRGAVRGFLASLVRRAEADRGAAAEQYRPVVGGHGLLDRGIDRVRAVAAATADPSPHSSLEPRGRVAG